MKVTLTPYGMPQVAVIPVILMLAAGLCHIVWPIATPWPQIPLILLVLFSFSFFRDPERTLPTDDDILLAPADGKITDIIEVEEQNFIQGPAIRIGIFLSVFNVHINRTPCAGRVAWKQEKPGLCLNALNTEACSQKNQSTTIGLDCPNHPAGKVIVKQITGAIARRIVCPCQIGQFFEAGHKYGMIKFGSRTELYLPAEPKPQILTKPGDTIKAGSTILVRYPKLATTCANTSDTPDELTEHKEPEN